MPAFGIPLWVVRQSHPGEIAAPPRWNWSFTGVEYQMKVVVITDGMAVIPCLIGQEIH